MAAIYIPQGAAREYSPLAMNYITGCDHGCKFCYVPRMMKRFRSDYIHSDVYIKEVTVLRKEILASARKHRNSPDQVFLSFLTDPYSHFNNDTKLTREVLLILLEHKIPVSILSKGGLNVLQDMDVFKRFGPNIQVGASLTFSKNEDQLNWQTNSSRPEEQWEALQILHANGIKTWASIEPVIIPEQSLELMDITHEYVDAFKIGKLNHLPKQEAKVDWSKFLVDSVRKMQIYEKAFYIKKDLLAFKPNDLYLSPEETDMDHLALKNQFTPPVFLSGRVSISFPHA